MLVTAMVVLGRRIAVGVPFRPQKGTAPSLTPDALVSKQYRSGEVESPLRRSWVVTSNNLSLLLVVVSIIPTTDLLIIIMVVTILIVIIALR